MVHLAEKGRGRALKRVWSASESDVLVYMDVDLSTDLAALLPLVAPLVSGHSDLAIGSRLARHSRVERGAKRELISRSYNLLLRQTLRARFSDAQCGFKAIRRDAARELLPAGRGQRVVLRHRAARRRRAGRAADPRGAGRLGRRPRQQRRHRAHRRSTTCAGMVRLGRVAASAAPCRCARSASGSAAPAPRPAAAGSACRSASSW